MKSFHNIFFSPNPLDIQRVSLIKSNISIKDTIQEKIEVNKKKHKEIIKSLPIPLKTNINLDKLFEVERISAMDNINFNKSLPIPLKTNINLNKLIEVERISEMGNINFDKLFEVERITECKKNC